MQVSVVIPVFNPGRDIDRCIASVLDQSLPLTEYEAIFVDDGSTDETPDRLDALAAEHPHIRVIHIPNSGWPGKPRNVGVVAAGGRYVQFLDQDDRLDPTALERLVAYGDAHGADIVIGKVASDFRGVALGVFARDRPRCTIHDAPLIDSLTPHKLFRRAFLAEHRIAFPEGRRRLEDQLYMVKAYFAASNVAILAAHPCYFYLQRSGGENAGSRRIVPAEYYGNLREVLDVVLANTEVGDERSRLLRRFARVEILGRVSEPSYLAFDDAFRAELFRAARSALVGMDDAGALAGLPPVGRLRADLLVQGREADLLELARRMDGWRADCRIRSTRWDDGRLTIEFEVGVASRDGRPLQVLGHDGRYLLAPDLTDGLVDVPLDVTDDIDKIRATAWIRDEATAVDWRLSVRTEVRLESEPAGEDGWTRLRPRIAGALTIDPRRAALGRALEPGRWLVWLRVSAFGIDLRTHLGGAGAPATSGPMATAFGDPERLVVLTRVSGSGSEPGLDVSTDGVGERIPTGDGPSLDALSSVGGFAVRLDVRQDGFPGRGRSVTVHAAPDDLTPGRLLGVVRRDILGAVYFEEPGLPRSTRFRRAARRDARIVWRHLPPGVRARIRSILRAVRGR